MVAPRRCSAMHDQMCLIIHYYVWGKSLRTEGWTWISALADTRLTQDLIYGVSTFGLSAQKHATGHGSPTCPQHIADIYQLSCCHDAAPIPIEKWTGEFIAMLPFLGACFALLPFTHILSSLLNSNQSWVWGPITYSGFHPNSYGKAVTPQIPIPKRACEFSPASIFVCNFCAASLHSSSLLPIKFSFSLGMGASVHFSFIAMAAFHCCP